VQKGKEIKRGKIKGSLLPAFSRTKAKKGMGDK